MGNKKKANWKLIPGQPLTEMDKRILSFQERGKLCPSRELIKTPEQIEGIRKAGVLNTAVLDTVAEKIREGMTTEEIDRIVYETTTKGGGIPAPLNYEGFPKSCCTSINEVVCHGVPSEDVVLEEGDIINVDCTTILNGYYADASRMFVIGKTTPQKQKLVDVAWHEDPDVEHRGAKGTGMLLVPGMTFTIEPMINMGTWRVFVDEDDPYGWEVISDDELPSAQWEHTFVMTENGVEKLAW